MATAQLWNMELNTARARRAPQQKPAMSGHVHKMLLYCAPDQIIYIACAPESTSTFFCWSADLKLYQLQ
jgi:hypothetical protein